MTTPTSVQAANPAILALTAINLALESQIKQLELERAKTEAAFKQALQEAQTLIKNLETELAQLKNSQIMQRAKLQALVDENQKLKGALRTILSGQGEKDPAWCSHNTPLFYSSKNGLRKSYTQLSPHERAKVEESYRSCLPFREKQCHCSRNLQTWYDCPNRDNIDGHYIDSEPPLFYYSAPVNSPFLREFGSLIDEIFGSRNEWAPPEPSPEEQERAALRKYLLGPH